MHYPQTPGVHLEFFCTFNFLAVLGDELVLIRVRDADMVASGTRIGWYPGEGKINVVPPIMG